MTLFLSYVAVVVSKIMFETYNKLGLHRLRSRTSSKSQPSAHSLF